MWRGWSVPRLAALAGVDRQCLDGALRKGNIYARTHVGVTALYDRLWDQRPPEPATENGSAPLGPVTGRQPTVGLRRSPGDDDRIDDPTLTETEKHAKARELLAGGLTVKAVTTRARLDRKRSTGSAMNTSAARCEPGQHQQRVR